MEGKMTRFPNGTSRPNQRAQAAAVRAIGAHERVVMVAKNLNSELGDATPAHGVPVTELPDDDSMVVAIVAAIESGEATK